MSRTGFAEPITQHIDLPVADGELMSAALHRVTGADLLSGNAVRLLVDATENYPEWYAAIENARERIFFESYIIHGDEQGELLADALIKKVKEGVEVKVIYDWLGGLWITPRSFWRRLRENGVEVRCYNPPKLYDPLGVLSRDHRKVMVVDGKVAFVSGLCIGQDWVGNEDRGAPPWRDTGVKLEGPAVADVEAAFAAVWAETGEAIDPRRLSRRSELSEAGDFPARVVQSLPGASRIYRLDQLLAAAAVETMWIADAYFVGVPSYMQNLRDAAEGGVDVRLLVPQSTDIGIIRDTTRSTYRPLLTSGIRVFEWNGSMMHAKTAVFDGKYSRVGSTNMNIASWFGNYELDILVEDRRFGAEMQQMFLRDLEGSTEIVLKDTESRPKAVGGKRRMRKPDGGSVRRTTAGALNAAASIGSAMTRKTVLGPAEARLLAMVGGVLLAFALLLIVFPRGASIPIVVLLLLLAIPTLFKAIQNYRKG